MTSTVSIHEALREDRTYRELRSRFSDIFAGIAEGVVDREKSHQLPFDRVRELQEAGFGALRVPVSYGGDGVSAQHLFRLFAELAGIDSNVAHVWRGHFAFLEEIFFRGSDEERRWWAGRVVDGQEFVGNAQSETGNENYWDLSTVLRRDGDGTLVLDGEKYYSTGTIFADWTNVTARYGDDIVNLPVRTDAPGVTVVDDWDGFGQQLTGTGTTTFRSVVVDPRWISSIGDRNRAAVEGRRPSYIQGFYQLFLLAVLVGNAQGAVRETAAHVAASSRRPLDAGPGTYVRDDPLVQAVIGRHAAVADSASATLTDAARALQLAWEAGQAADSGDTAVTEEDVAHFARSAELRAFSAQVAVIPEVLDTVSRVFDAAGASSTSRKKDLDRFWRNARTVASHNPLANRERIVGKWVLTGEFPARPTRPGVQPEEDE